MDALKQTIELCARGVEILGIITIIAGTLMALIKFIFAFQGGGERSYKLLRQELGKAILLGLEILVAGDIIATVVTEPTMERVIILAIIVIIRTFLSLSIQVEIEGRFPWQRFPAEEKTE